MKVDIVPIGNSRGIRIPKPLLEQCGFEDTADVIVEDGRLVFRPTAAPRAGWDEAFRRMTERSDDRLLETPPPAFDANAWTW